MRNNWADRLLWLVSLDASIKENIQFVRRAEPMRLKISASGLTGSIGEAAVQLQTMPNGR